MPPAVDTVRLLAAIACLAGRLSTGVFEALLKILAEQEVPHLNRTSKSLEASKMKAAPGLPSSSIIARHSLKAQRQREAGTAKPAAPQRKHPFRTPAAATVRPGCNSERAPDTSAVAFSPTGSRGLCQFG
jgi:hypothetical protein